MKIAFLGTGNVGGALATRLAEAGHTVVLAARDLNSGSVQKTLARHGAITAKAIPAAVAEAEAVFLATPYAAAEAALAAAGDLSGKILVDCTNPIGAGLKLVTGPDDSGGETIQRLQPAAHVVKAFTIYGFENFEDPSYPGYGDLKPAMLLCGDHDAANRAVAGICAELGWEPIITGDVSHSRYLEQMTLLWIQMARAQGRGAGFTWAMLKR